MDFAVSAISDHEKIKGGAMQFQNPANGYVESKPVPWLWALLFGGIYFAASGLWAPFIVWILIALTLYSYFGPPATLLMVVVAVIYAVMANMLVRNAYLRKGWVEVGGNVSPQSRTGHTAQAHISSDGIVDAWVDSAEQKRQQSMNAVKVELKDGRLTSVGQYDGEPAPSNKKCPFCAEDIKLEAIKCKHCGSDLNAVA